MSGPRLAFARGIGYNELDAQSTSPRERLRSDALAFCFAAVTDSRTTTTTSSSSSSSTFSPEIQPALKSCVCVIDPNVAYLIVSMRKVSLGPVDDLKRASVICVPIADFDVGQPEAGAHWTMLVLHRMTTAQNGDAAGSNPAACLSAPSVPGNQMLWFQPIHIDSATRNGGADSSNARFAARAAHIFISGLAQLASDDTCAVAPAFVTGINNGQATQSTSAMNVQLLRSTPQQQNSVDCGVFAALALGAVYDLVGARLQQQALNAPLFFGADEEQARRYWSFDQAVASQFKARVHKEMMVGFN